MMSLLRTFGQRAGRTAGTRACLVSFLLSLVFCPIGVSAHDDIDAPERITVEEKTGEKLPPDLRFADEQGNMLALKNLITGKPAILNLVYYGCDRICPQVLAALARALPKMALAPGKDYTVLTLSFDEYDTPQTAREAKKNYLKALASPVPDDAWRFLTGTSGEIGRLTESVGFRFERDDHGFIHPITLIILAPDGTINRYISLPKSGYGVEYPLNFSAPELQAALNGASRGQIGAAVKRAFLYCIPHEPKNQAAFFRLLSISGAATLIGVLALFLVLRRRPAKKPPGSGHESA